jgi:hypothetical protein
MDVDGRRKLLQHRTELGVKRRGYYMYSAVDMDYRGNRVMQEEKL